MEILDEVANDLKINKEDLARDSLKFFISNELSDTEAEMFKIAIRYGIKSVLEFNELLKAGSIVVLRKKISWMTIWSWII